MGEIAEVEIYALSDLNDALIKLSESISTARDEAFQALEEESSRLEGCRAKCEEEVNRCQSALDACLSCVDEDGNPPPCTAERQALVAAERDLRRVEDHIKSFSTDANKYQEQIQSQWYTSKFAIEDACRNLEKHIGAGLDYLKDHPELLGNIPGAGAHGTRYRGTTREYLRRVAEGRLGYIEGNEDYQGFLQNEFAQGGHISRPPHFVTAHRVAGIDIPENYDIQYYRYNLARMSYARHARLPRTNY